MPICTHCGAEIADTWPCHACGATPIVTAEQAVEDIPNHLVGAILTTMFCFTIFGIVAIAYAAQVNALLRVGDTKQAIASSNKAETWIRWSFGIGLIGIVAHLIYRFG